MFITIEGIDGAGKTTQIKLLEEFLSDKGFDFISIREPGGTAFSESLRNILLTSNFEINPVSELLLFEAARSDLVEKVIKPSLNDGKIVICDRFYDSTTAYQAFGRGINLETVLNLHNLATNALNPDLTIFLNISFELSLERTKDKIKDRMEKSGEEFFQRVYNGFQEISKMFPERIKIINAENSIEDIHQEILKSIFNEKK